MQKAETIQRKASYNQNYVELYKNDKEHKRQRKLRDIEIAQINKTIHEMQREKIIMDKERKIQSEIEDARLMKKLLYCEVQKEKELKREEKEDIEQYENEQKKIRERREKIREQEESLAEVWSKYQERIRCKEQRVLEQIYRHDSIQSKNNYDMIQTIQKEKNKRYDEFIEKGIMQNEKQFLKKEQDEIEKQKRDRENAFLLAKSNKLAGLNEITVKYHMDMINKCVCDKQSLFTKSCKNRMNKYMCRTEKVNSSSSFVVTAKLETAIKERESEPSPWTGLEAAHAQFAQQATDTLRQCRYKTMARKVINEYRYTSRLDTSTLPISNF